MPRGDRTGPSGQGSRTGEKNGYCSGNDKPGFINSEGTCLTGHQMRGHFNHCVRQNSNKGKCSKKELKKNEK
ncbi:MAG: DUF5320 domain-containing protein [Spirochaetota bacterium]|nr:DUF5320 domain-containing protein [Spirochaetota bacterium]